MSECGSRHRLLALAGMDHLAIPVSDQERSRHFYESYFGFGAKPSRVYDDGVPLAFVDGSQQRLDVDDRGAVERLEVADRHA